MSGISSTSSYLSSGSNGMAGLVSGMDTTAMVEEMLAGTQAKIDKQNESKTILQYEQDMYRDTATLLRNLQSKFFDFVNPTTNLLSSSFYNQFTPSLDSIMSQYLSVQAGSDYEGDELAVDYIRQLASKTVVTSASDLTDATISGTVDLSKLAEATGEEDLTVTLNLDGISKDIVIDSSITSTSQLVDNLNEQIKRVFGNGINVTATGDEISFETVQANGDPDKSRQLTISSSGLATDLLGVNNGGSTKISGSSKLSDINFATELTPGADGNYSFSINGVDFSFSGDTTLNGVIEEVNNSDAGVEMKYSALSDRITIERTETGAGLDIEMSDTGGTLLASLFGSGSGVDATMSAPLAENELIAPAGTDLSVSFDFGSEFPPISINLAGKSISQVAEELQDQIHEHQAPPEANVTYDPDTGRLAITGVASYPVIITGNNDQAAAKLAELFGSSSVSMGSTPATLGNKIEGQNAILSINGVETERSSNEFSVSGLQMELKATNWDGVSTKPAVGEIDVDHDTDAIVDGILSFVDEYNKIIEELNTLVTAEAEYRDYPPLTDDQKKEMTESEIELWEEKAREGLLRNDDILTGIMQEMRAALYQKPEDAEFALYEFGIETTTDWRDGGKLQVDETLLREMVNNHSDELNKLFTDEEDGVGVKLEAILDDATRTNSTNPGSIVAMAGYTGMVEANYTIGREQNSLDEYIERLEDSYQMEYDRYWSEFNAMEQMIANMNTQSSWLASQFA